MNTNTKVVNLAMEGKLSNKQIAMEVGWSHESVRAFLMKNGIKRRPEIKIDLEEAANRLRAGETIKAISRSLNVDKDVLRRRLVSYMPDYDAYTRDTRAGDVDMESKRLQALRYAKRGVKCVHEIAYRVGGVSSDKIGEWLASSSA
jgi:hypothetical protein